MSTWDLNRLRYAIRKITGKYDITQLPDTSSGEINVSNPAAIDDYINDFYLYDLPEHFRTLKLRDFYTFFTIPNCGTYSVPENIYEVYNPIYIDNYQFAWYQYPEIFYNVWPELNFVDAAIATANGIKQTYTFTLTQTPIQQGTVVIGLQPNTSAPLPTPSVPLETFTDKDQPIPLDIPAQQYFVNPAPLTGSMGGTGSINYLTGQVSITYAAVNGPPAGTNINAHYHPYVASRPRDIMYWQDQLFLRPIPNDTYAVKVMAYVMPTTVMNAATNATVRPSIHVNGNNDVTVQGFSGNSGSAPTDLPAYNEWWQLIAYGAAIKILVEDGEWTEVERYKPIFEEQKLLAQRKSLRQLAHQRIETIYSNKNINAPQFPIFPQY